MKIYYDERACGAGKSYCERSIITSREGLYIWAVEQRKMMVEPFHQLRAAAADHGRTPTIRAIFSAGEHLDPALGEAVDNVRVEVEALASTYTRGHVIIITTHEALKAADLTKFEGQGWQVIIDETISIWDQQAVQTTVSIDWLKQHYDLVQTDDEGLYKIVSLTDHKAKDFAADSMARSLTVMHQRIISDRSKVITNVADWSEVSADEKGRWKWWSMWNPTSLEVFDRVTMLANNITASVTYETIRSEHPEIEWVNLNRPTIQTYAQRKVVVHYYAAAHEARRSIWNSHTGRAFLRAVAADIEKRVWPHHHIWMCNDVDDRSLRVNGEQIHGMRLTPRQSGIDKYGDQYHHASMIFTAKPSPDEEVIMKAIGVSREAIIATREHEVLVQFATRTSLRRANSTETVHLTVYDDVQAKMLEKYLLSTGYCDVELQLHRLTVEGVELADWVKIEEKRGPKIKVLTDEQKAERAAKRTASNAERQRRFRERKRAMVLEAAE